METSSIIIASCLALLSLAHSVLGEREILAPLFRSDWDEPSPRWAMERILRFAWHLTSLAWLGLGAAVLGVDLHLAIALVTLTSAAIVFILLRGHLAWPLFALAGVASLYAKGVLDAPILSAAVLITLTCVFAIAFLHIYWVAGGSWGLSAAVPGNRDDSGPQFHPPAWLTAMVAAALLCFAGLIAWTWHDAAAPQWPRILLYLAIGVLTLRAVGDGRQVGFSKTQRNSKFAKWDDRLFTPLSVLMAFGSGAALLA